MAGRPPALDITPEVISKVESLAAQGLVMEQIAAVLGIGTSTVYKNQAQNVEFAEAIKRGRAKGIATVTNALFAQAKTGNTTAMIFYLKNRDRESWKDIKPIELTGSDGKDLFSNIQRVVVDGNAKD